MEWRWRKKLRKNQEHNATMSKQLSGFLKSKFHETNLIAFFNRIKGKKKKKNNLHNISGLKEMKWMYPEISLQRWILPGWYWGLSHGLKPGWKAMWAAGGRPWSGWEMASNGMLLAGSEMGWYLQSIIINDLQEVTSRTLIKHAHVAKWELGGENTGGRHIIPRYLFFSFCDLACRKCLDFGSPPLSLLSWA